MRKNNNFDSLVAPISKKTQIFTRKFSLRPQVKNAAEELSVADGIREQFLKFRDLENEFVEVAVGEIKRNPLLIEQFRSNSSVAYKGNFYDYFKFNLYEPKTFKQIEFKERVMRCAAFPSYWALRNWVIKNENLKVIVDDLVQQLSSPKYRDSTLKSFLGKGTLSNKQLKVVQSHLKKDVFGGTQWLSNEYLKNHVAHLRNLLALRRALDEVLRDQIAEILVKPKVLKTFVELVLYGFTQKVNKRDEYVLPKELAGYFADLFVRLVKSRTTKMARRKLNSKDKKLKGRSALANLVNSVEFKTSEEFQNERDAQIIPDVRKELNNIAIFYGKRIIRKKIEDLLDDYLLELREPHRNLTESAFKPVFSRAKIESLDRTGFETYFFEKLKHKIKGEVRRLLLSANVAKEAIKKLKYVMDNIYDFVSPPKFKNLTVPIVSYEQIYEFRDADLSAELKFVKRTPANKLFISHQKNNSKKEVEKENRFKEMVRKCERTPPVLKMEGRKVILCQPFYKIKGDEALSDAFHKGGEITMGVDQGIKHFAVLSVQDESANKELERYFLDERALFDMKFNESNGKFEFHNERVRKRPTNIKWKLIHLRKERRDVQSQLSDLQNQFPNKRFYHSEKRLSSVWNKENNIHSEIVNQLSHKIVQLAKHHGVSTIKFENLKWSKHSKRIDVGQFLAWNQVLMFFSQVQSHVAQYARREGIKVALVDARDTSKICSKCRLTRADHKDKEGATRRGKQFVCTHSSHARFQLDADLNAARNITLSKSIKTVT